jgi:radical SAM superfamily enzyme with C-terminal helix-hairpin-helix motif
MVLILDFYVDEPACFGVPPYLSPYCRYAAGALVAGGVPAEQISYMTVDQWRSAGKSLPQEYELVLLISGTTVPGRYLGGKIGTVAEVLEFLELQARHDPHSTTLIGGPIRYASPEIQKSIRQKKGWLIRGDLEYYAERLAAHPEGIQKGVHALLENARHPVFPKKRTYEDVDRYAVRGAFLTELHPNYPYLILELETYRGCTREIFCSFCTEAFYGRPVFRNPQGIFEEVAELSRMGNRYFRIGRQADLMTYLPDMNDFQNSFPRPVPENLELLYAGIRRAAPDLKLLHLDNINPGLIATFPEESRRIIQIICRYNTPGDTAAMGLESADPAVIAANDLKCSPEEAMRAIEIINEFGAARTDGLPRLLPGINLIHGLAEETERTFEKNYLFLKKVLDSGLLLRRINIRQAMPYRNTKLERSRRGQKLRGRNRLEQRFLYYRDRIRKEIDHAFLKKNFPAGTILREVILEGQNAGYMLGRPLGSYPVTVKIPLDDALARQAEEERRPLDVIITGWEERSVHGLHYPVDLRRLGLKAMKSVPVLGHRQAEDLFLRLGRGEVSEEELVRITERLAALQLDSVSA